MRIEWLINKTYQVTDGETVWFQGSLSDCKSYLHNGVKSFSAEQVVNELKDCETLDDAIMYFSEINK